MGLGFAMVIVLGVVMALVAWVQFTRASAEATVLVEDRMVKVTRANEIIDNLNSQANAVRNDSTVAAVKLGMLGSLEMVDTVV